MMQFICALPIIAGLSGACAEPSGVVGYVEGDYALIAPMIGSKKGRDWAKAYPVGAPFAGGVPLANPEERASPQVVRLARHREGCLQI